MIEGAGIAKRFGGVVALDDASFAAEAGEVHALVGENGAGKSTMIKILSGVLRPDAGTVRIDGSEVRLRSPEDALARGVATVFQELTLLGAMTVAENLLLGREPRGRLRLIRRRALNGEAAAILREFDVTSVDAGALVEEIPLAQRQLVEIVHAVMRKPKVLFLDEPTSALSRREVEWLFALVRRLRDDGTCVIFTSHRCSEVTDLADRITIFRSAMLGMGDPYLFQSIAAVVIGGTYILGGRGHYAGTVAGAIVLTALISVLLAKNAPDYARDIVYGVVILVILLFYGRQSEEPA